MVMGIYKCLQALHLISTCVWLQFLSETFNFKSLCNTIAPLCVLGSITSPWQQLIGRTILSNKLRLFWGRISYHRAAFSQRTTVVLHKKTHDPFDISAGPVRRRSAAKFIDSSSAAWTSPASGGLLYTEFMSLQFSCNLIVLHWAVVGRTLIWASWCGPVCCVDTHSDSFPGGSWG